MKYIGAAVMPAFLSVYSIMISLRLRKRAEILDKTFLMLNEIKIMLEYSCPSMYELIQMLAEKECYMGMFTSECKKELEEGIDFPAAWSSAVEKYGIYKKEERDKLIQLGSLLGTSDLESQLSVLQMYIISFDAFRKDAQVKNQKYAGTSVFVGTFCAFGLFVMLI